MERNFRRLKNQEYPKAPKTADEIMKAYSDPIIAEKFGNNLRNSARFYRGTVIIPPKSAFTIFASQQIIDLVKKHIPEGERTYMMDGTFAVVPVASYYQLLIIYIQYKNDVRFYIYIILTYEEIKSFFLGISPILCDDVGEVHRSVSDGLQIYRRKYLRIGTISIHDGF